MCAEGAAVFIPFSLIFGLPMAIKPYTVARWGEIVDAIGREPAGRVEPADWNVTATRLFGVAILVFGGLYVVSCID